MDKKDKIYCKNYSIGKLCEYYGTVRTVRMVREVSVCEHPSNMFTNCVGEIVYRKEITEINANLDCNNYMPHQEIK
jgi:hypothetical protein